MRSIFQSADTVLYLRTPQKPSMVFFLSACDIIDISPAKPAIRWHPQLKKTLLRPPAAPLPAPASILVAGVSLAAELSRITGD